MCLAFKAIQAVQVTLKKAVRKDMSGLELVENAAYKMSYKRIVGIRCDCFPGL